MNPNRRYVKVDTEDGQITVDECVHCGMLDPDMNPHMHLCEAVDG